jgi:MYXO-CTERM domain-containing protein
MQRELAAAVMVICLTFVTTEEARAQPSCDPASVGCFVDETPAEWRYRNAAFDDVMIDTGWQPPGAPIQLRFVLSFGGSAEVDMDADVVTEWPAPLTVSAPGRPETGRLAINYGIELQIQLRFDVNVAGVRYRWEGDIPVPGIPEDLRAAAEGNFDPYLLPPSERPFTVMDTTDRVEVVRYDALGGIIPVPGVGGGIVVTVQGDLAVSYQTIQIVVGDASPITMEDAFTVVGPDTGEIMFGAAKDLLIHPEGVLGFDATINVAPGLYLSFAGTRRDYPLVEIPITVADELVDVIFDDHATHVPLPDIRMSGTSYDLGEVPVGESSERTLTIDNVGEAELEVTLAMPGSPFGVDEPSLTLAPGAEESFTVTFAPETGGVANGVVLLRTNDPDESTVAVRLTGSGIETTMPMDDGGTPMDDGGMPMDDGGAMMVPEDGGCGCRSAGAGDGARGWPLFAVLALLAPLRRRR